MPLTTLKSAVKSALLQDDAIFSVDALYVDFFGPTSPSTRTRYKQERWLEFVKLSNNEFCTAEDIIFISCIIAHRSRNNEFKDYISKIRADEDHPAFDLFDPEGKNGLAHRHSMMTKAQAKKISNLQTTVESHSAKLEALEADNAVLKADNVKLNNKTNKLEADNVKLNNVTNKLNDITNKLEVENVAIKTFNATLKADNAVLKADNVKLNNKTNKLEADNVKLNNKTNKLEADIAELKSYCVKIQADFKSLVDKVGLLVDSIESVPEHFYNATYSVLSMFNPPIKDTINLALKQGSQKVKQYLLQDVKNILSGK